MFSVWDWECVRFFVWKESKWLQRKITPATTNQTNIWKIILFIIYVECFSQFRQLICWMECACDGFIWKLKLLLLRFHSIFLRLSSVLYLFSVANSNYQHQSMKKSLTKIKYNITCKYIFNSFIPFDFNNWLPYFLFD